MNILKDMMSEHVNDWRTFERNNKFVALNALYAPEGEMTVRHAYKSKYNLKRENQVILLMINEGESKISC